VIGLSGMVVAVVNDVIGNGMPVLCVELFEKCLGHLLTLEAELLDEAVGLDLPVIGHLTQVEIGANRPDGIELVGTDGWLSGLTVFGVDIDSEPIVADPFLGRHRDTGMSLCHTGVAAVDIRVRKPSSRNPHGGSASSGSERVVGSRPPNAERRALLPDVPTNTRQDLNATSEAEESHAIYF